MTVQTTHHTVVDTKIINSSQRTKESTQFPPILKERFQSFVEFWEVSTLQRERLCLEEDIKIKLAKDALLAAKKARMKAEERKQQRRRQQQRDTKAVIIESSACGKSEECCQRILKVDSAAKSGVHAKDEEVGMHAKDPRRSSDDLVAHNLTTPISDDIIVNTNETGDLKDGSSTTAEDVSTCSHTTTTSTKKKQKQKAKKWKDRLEKKGKKKVKQAAKSEISKSKEEEGQKPSCEMKLFDLPDEKESIPLARSWLIESVSTSEFDAGHSSVSTMSSKPSSSTSFLFDESSSLFSEPASSPTSTRKRELFFQSPRDDETLHFDDESVACSYSDALSRDGSIDNDESKIEMISLSSKDASLFSPENQEHQTCFSPTTRNSSPITICPATTLTSMESIFYKQNSVDIRPADQVENFRGGFLKSSDEENDCDDDAIENLPTLFDETIFDNHDEDDDTSMQLKERNRISPFDSLNQPEKSIRDETRRGADIPANKHVALHQGQQLAHLEEKCYRLQHELDDSQQEVINWRQKALLHLNHNERLRQDLQKAKGDIVISDGTKAEDDQNSGLEVTNENLRRELGNMQRQLECLKFAYEDSRGTHDMDLDICGGQISSLSNKIRQQYSLIERLTNENCAVKNQKALPLEGQISPEPVAVSYSGADEYDNSQCMTASRRQSQRNLTNVYPSVLQLNPPPLDNVEIRIEEGKEKSLPRSENSHLRCLLEISHTKVEQLEAMLERRQTAIEGLEGSKKDAPALKERLEYLEAETMRVKEMAEAQAFRLCQQIETEAREFEEEKDRLLDRIVDVESDLVPFRKRCGGVNYDNTKTVMDLAKHQCDDRDNLATPGQQEMKCEKKFSEDDEFARLQTDYKNLQISMQMVEDDNECLRDRIVDLEDKTRIQERHWECENEYLRDRIVDLEEKLRKKEHLLS